MENSIISEGKTTNEAIEKGLEKLNVSKNMVDIKVLENEDKRSFFSILSPRIVKVELTLKEKQDNSKICDKIKKTIELSKQELDKASDNLSKFLDELLNKLSVDASYEIIKGKQGLNVNINGKNIGFLIGYRGETLYSLQNIMSVIAGKGIESKVRVILDIEGYKAKREKTLEELAQKVAKTVIRTKKPITLEPMQAYERKIIHTKLQENNAVETTSVGEEPNRRIVISLKK